MIHPRNDAPSNAPRRPCRGAHTMIELLTSMAAASILLGGMASSIFIASHALNATDTAFSR